MSRREYAPISRFSATVMSRNTIRPDGAADELAAGKASGVCLRQQLIEPITSRRHPEPSTYMQAGSGELRGALAWAPARSGPCLV